MERKKSHTLSHANDQTWWIKTSVKFKFYKVSKIILKKYKIYIFAKSNNNKCQKKEKIYTR